MQCHDRGRFDGVSLLLVPLMLQLFLPCSGLDRMTEKAAPDEGHHQPTLKEIAESGTHNVQPLSEIQDPMASEVGPGAEAGGKDSEAAKRPPLEKAKSLVREVCVCVRERERERA